MNSPATLTGAVRAEILRRRAPGKEFTIRDVEKIVARLAPKYPSVARVTGTFRCMLQRLRDREGLIFAGRGHYRWPEPWE